MYKRQDLAWPVVKVAAEYDGRHHIEREGQWRQDLARREDLEHDGWRFVVVTGPDLFRTPGATLERTVRALAAAGLVVPLFGSILAAVLLLTASAMTLGAHRLDWVAARPGAWVMGLALGVGVAAVALPLGGMEQLGRWVGPVAPARSWLARVAAEADGVVLLPLAGLGWDRLGARRHLAPNLSAMAGRDILTVAPSTTATAPSPPSALPPPRGAWWAATPTPPPPPRPTGETPRPAPDP